MGNCLDSGENDSNTLHIISVVFNPSGYNSRVKLYNEYRDRLERVPGVKLYTIECLFGGQRASVVKRSHDILVQAPNQLWLKENLINIAVRALPKNWKYMAWVDGDIEFHGNDWVQKTISQLKINPIVQMWEKANFLGPDHRVLEVCTSFGYYVANNHRIDITKFHNNYPHPGFAWAMTRFAFERIGGLPDFCVVGSGDNHFAYALIGRVMDSIPPQSVQFISDDYKRKLLEFQHQVKLAVYAPHLNHTHVGPAYVNTTISHHWHGDWKDRKYVSRWECLEAQSGYSRVLFRPSHDLGYTHEGVLYCKNTAFLKSFKKYFDDRKEDDMIVRTDHKNKHGRPPVTNPSPQRPPVTSRPNFRSPAGTGYHYRRPAVRSRPTRRHHRNTYDDDYDDDCYTHTDFSHYDCHNHNSNSDYYLYDNNQHGGDPYCYNGGGSTGYEYGGCGGGGGYDYGGGGGGGGDVFSASNHAYC